MPSPQLFDLRKPASIQADHSAFQSLKRYFEFIKSKQGVKSHISVINHDFLKRCQVRVCSYSILILTANTPLKRK